MNTDSKIIFNDKHPTPQTASLKAGPSDGFSPALKVPGKRRHSGHLPLLIGKSGEIERVSDFLDQITIF
jgi:hypothetical protein